MFTFARWFILGMLLMSAVCHSQQEASTPTASAETALVVLDSTVAIEGDPVAIFDLATMARFWPQWHPASIEVAGVTERPFQLHDRIREQVRIGDSEFVVIWKIVEHLRSVLSS